jgi:hypothetical protein
MRYLFRFLYSALLAWGTFLLTAESLDSHGVLGVAAAGAVATAALIQLWAALPESALRKRWGATGRVHLALRTKLIELCRQDPPLFADVDITRLSLHV